MFLLNPRFLLPLLIVTGVLVMGLRLNDVLNAAASGRLDVHAAQAATGTDKMQAPAPVAAPSQQAPTPALSAPPAGSTALSAAPHDDGDSSVDIDVLKQLSDRREQLEKRARDLDTREAMIKVAEQRVDQKIKEMDTLRQQLQGMVSQVGEAQAAQMDNLVKIYETMKPEEAAKIFEALDMPILLGVIQRMKPARTAPILAKMAPEKAKEVTTALSHQDQLPKIK